MGHTRNTGFLGWFATLVLFLAVTFTEVSASISHDINVDRCKDESYCKGYCLSTNPETVSARCGSDLSSCICITPNNHAVKVRFVEERNPVPPTQPTTPRPPQAHYQPGPGVQYVNAQSIPNSQYYYNGGNHNSIAGGQQQQQPSRTPNPPSPVLLECDASEASTRTCHLFCTMEIQAWYGLCNITSKACACFGVPLSAVQTEPIAAIFHSTAPLAPPPPPTTQRPPHNPSLYGRYPQQQHQQQYPQQPNQQQWRPVPPQHQTSYPYPSMPTLLNQAPPNNQLHEQGPVRTAAGSYALNGQTATSSFTTSSVDHGHHGATSTSSQADAQSISNQHNNTDSSNVKVTSAISEEDADITATAESTSRKRRSINDMSIEGKESSSQKDLALMGDCSKFKCGLSCKRNNYLAPDCTPKCMEGQCVCECLPRN
ncbi:unnamed protein product [Orchesella dallaii]|uniref:Uncharacterized protein n=1 Tax=Orchesella dallaii TaxID=48710 RepID=A0ABP1QP87_9HEXA